MSLLDRVPLHIALILALTLGLSPFFPEPHITEKLRMLVAGTLTRPLDIFDLLWHGWTWVLLAAVLLRRAMKRG